MTDFWSFLLQTLTASGAAAALLGAAAIWIFLRKRKHHAEKNG